MWLIVGLGNPGSRYARTRHNVGFLVLEEFAGKYNLKFRDRDDYRICNGSIDGTEAVLVEPLTFMNRSGPVVKKTIRKFNIPPGKLIVIHDDLDMEPGRLRIRKSGSHGGHRGVGSVIESIGSRDFIRIKIGIGRDENMLVEDYVLSKFRRDEIPLIREAVHRASEAVYSIMTDGIDYAMNSFN